VFFTSVRKEELRLNYTHNTEPTKYTPVILFEVYYKLQLLRFICVIVLYTRVHNDDPRRGSKHVGLAYSDCNL
jgi:hypothetical protein